jgi:NADPH:quinone reductase
MFRGKNVKEVTIINQSSAYSLEISEVPMPTPRAGEVLVRVAAAGVNRADILQAMGKYPPPQGVSVTLGLEVSGNVVERGEGVAWLNVGDRVCALVQGGGYAEYVLVHESCVLPVPKGVSLIEAAALPEAYFTIWANLIDTAQLKPSDSVLIHGGASGIGSAAILFCAAMGHTVFATASNSEKCRACIMLGATYAINYNDEDFVTAIMSETSGSGVDVILDVVGGDYIERNFAAAAMCGRIVNIAFQNGFIARVNFANMLKKRLTFSATTLRARANEEKKTIRDKLLTHVWPLFEQGMLKPVVDCCIPFANVRDAHSRMIKSKHIGKILLTI